MTSRAAATSASCPSAWRSSPHLPSDAGATPLAKSKTPQGKCVLMPLMRRSFGGMDGDMHMLAALARCLIRLK
jgi:hypothetical protein